MFTKRGVAWKDNCCSRIIALCLVVTILMTMIPSNIHVEAAEKEAVRYSVLLLDVSGSMKGDALTYQKSAAINFCMEFLRTEGTNYVSIISYETNIKVICDFTSNISELIDSIHGTKAGGGTYIEGALREADRLLSVPEIPADAVKNIVLCSDGLPSVGRYSYDGPYTKNDYYDYGYANGACNLAKTVRKNATLYTLGFFHGLNNDEIGFARRFMHEIAGAGSRYYEVTDPDELKISFDEVLGDITTNAKVSGEFYYASSGGKDYTSEFFYDDAYFTNSSYMYQIEFEDKESKLGNMSRSLATMSMCLAFSAFGSNRVPNTADGYKQKSQNLQDLLKKCGFPEDNFMANEFYTQKPGPDTIGVGVSHKTIMEGGQPYTLIAAAVRGGGYEKEWASNFTIGDSGKHHGFTQARDNVLSFLTEYINTKEIKGKVKIWIAGYSRAAATTNLVAGKIDDGHILSDAIELDRKDLFAYCFEAPQGAIATENPHGAIYSNIANIINPVDIVTKVAPTYQDKFPFTRYGVDHYLPTKVSAGKNYKPAQKLMLSKYNMFDSTSEYVVDDFWKVNLITNRRDILSAFDGWNIEAKKNEYNQEVFLNNFLDILFGQVIKNRDDYVKVYQEAIREICKNYFGTPSEKKEAFKEQLGSNFKKNLFPLIGKVLNLDYEGLKALIGECVFDALDTVGIKDYSKEDVADTVEDLAALILTIGAKNRDYLATAIVNGQKLGDAHLPELCLAWLQSMDTNYTPNAESAYTSGAYRILHINCPIDVNVYDLNNNLVASIINDECQELSDDSLFACVNENGEKLVYLPVNEDYRVDLTATDDGFMTYSINEHSEALGGNSRITSFQNVPLIKDTTLTSMVPSASEDEIENKLIEGSNSVYTLVDGEKNNVQPSINLSGDQAKAANYLVTVNANNDAYGYVQGSGVITSGNYVMLNAQAAIGCKFDGWYENDKLISTEPEYRFGVTKDHNIVGVFTGNGGSNGSTAQNSGSSNQAHSKGHKFVNGVCSICKEKDTNYLSAAKVTAKVSTSSVQLSWKAVDHATSYDVYRKLGTGKFKKVQTIKALKWTDKKVENGNSYTYKVCARAGELQGKSSAKQNVFYLKQGVIDKTKASKDGLQITVKKNSKATGYQIQYTTAKSFTKAKTVTVKGNQSKLIQKLKKDTAYNVRVRYYKKESGKNKYSAWSKVVKVKTKK